MGTPAASPLRVTPYSEEHYPLLVPLFDGQAVHLHMDWRSLGEWLEAKGSIIRIAWRDTRPVGIILISAPYHGATWLRALAVAEDEYPAPVIEALWDGMPQMLRKAGVRQLGALTGRPWLEHYLPRLGFRVYEWVITLFRSDGPP